MTGLHRTANVQDIPTTSAGTALTFSADVATLGLARFRNVDPTNYIEIGLQTSGTFYPFMRLAAGRMGSCWLVPSAVTYYARANTATAKLEWEVLEV